MSQVILDTNFIITCVKQKIDFFEELRFMGFQIIIPQQVLDELGRLLTKKGAVKDQAALSLRVVEQHKHLFKTIKFKKGYVDKGMVAYAKEHPRAVVATLDYALKQKIRNPIMVIRGKKKIEVV